MTGMVILSDENGPHQWPDMRISTTYQVGMRTVERTRKRLV